ncbi:MAG: alanine--glyoxylate aminotransferase family protein [Dehalococcoidia bacterium]|nr:alanine--glyoxylate aminotransferase family protein [Dehalococcoidia bacterium]MDD5494678.1 alanine--glyoxylate aminotransferase family protein [Dehalococcoidia bacterium]
MQLRIPGPTPCPDEILKAVGRQMINHRGKEFGEMQGRILPKLQQCFQTNNDIFILTTSGTGGMESAVVNTLSPGDKVLGISIGIFGDRFIEIAKAYGADVTTLNYEWGQVANPDDVKKALNDSPGIKAVLVTHNETSTGTTNPLRDIAKVVKDAGKLILVDAVSSLSSINLPVDEWDLDVVVTSSQKGWMVPPGLAFVSISEQGWKAHAQAKMPRYYFDYTKARKFIPDGQTPWTPAISVYFGLDLALDMMLKEGLQNIFARHARVAGKARAWVKSRGLQLLCVDEKYASNTVTAVKAPADMDVAKFNATLRDEYKVVIAGGQGGMKGKVFRIGHLGLITEKDMDEVTAALDKALPKAKKI